MILETELIDIASGEPVVAQLSDEVTLDDFLEAQAEWRPVVAKAAIQMRRAGAAPEHIPQHFHWDWGRKEPELRMLAFSFFAVRCADQLQGLMKVRTVGELCREESQRGKPLVYVDYLEVAPRNIKKLIAALGQNPVYGAVGTRLVEAAIRHSIDEGFEGRVALHSLPSSERFYLESCRMAEVHRDAQKQNLLFGASTHPPGPMSFSAEARFGIESRSRMASEESRRGGWLHCVGRRIHLVLC